MFQTENNPELVGNPSSAPVLGADGTIYFGAGDGNIYALDAATGRKKWESWVGIFPAMSPLTLGADGTLYFATGAGRLFTVPPALPQEVSGYVVAVQASSGLALSAWPKFQQNERNTGSVQDYFKSLPRFNHTLTRFTPDGFSLSVEGGIGQPHLIEWTSDWRIWTPLQLFTNVPSGSLILDRGASNSPSRFYRARSRNGN